MEVTGRHSSKRGGLELELEVLPGSTKKQKMRDLESILVRKEDSQKKNQILQPCSKPQDPCFLTLAPPNNNSSNLPDLNANSQTLDQSECASSTNPNSPSSSSSSPLKLWQKMKQNGFLSSSQNKTLIPPSKPKKTRKKSEEEISKQKRAYLQKEQYLQFSRFSKVTGPSGLLTGLNPGIINHVRNSKQVYSIIQAVVKDSSFENEELGFKDENCTDLKLGEDCREKEGSGVTGLGSEDFGSDKEAVTSLSLKAASAASQWMELLQQDIKGRLAALKRSKKRVRNVISTELPYIISTEISYNNDESSNVISQNGAHVEKWKFLFSHMDKSLHEESRYLENWLRQVQEMQMKCEKGVKYVVGMEGLLLGPINTEYSKAKRNEAMEHEQVVKAAAASLYSTCNLVTKKENISCF
ncbi:hypothetical protein LUZ60_003911 [Juncus effusus]|nr:hypothetical protein LUZ60_003911 [Juncus effusus]